MRSTQKGRSDSGGRQVSIGESKQTAANAKTQGIEIDPKEVKHHAKFRQSNRRENSTGNLRLGNLAGRQVIRGIDPQ